MSIVFFSVGEVGQVGEFPRRNKLTVTNSLSELTAAGFLNSSNMAGKQIYPTDIFDVTYSYTGGSFTNGYGTGTYGTFTVSISNGTITLVQWTDGGNVLLPVTSGDFSIFNGTTGQIKDSGLLPSASSQSYVVTSPGSLTSGNFPLLNDVNGTINAGRAPSAATAGYKVVMSPGSLTAGNLLVASDANGTVGDAGINYKYASASITLASWQGMFTTPIQIIAAQGASKLIVVHRAMIFQTYGSAQLTNGGPTGFQYGNTASLGGVPSTNTEQATDFQGATANQIYLFNGSSGNATNGTDQSNVGVYLTNTGSPWATGTGSSFTAHVWYSVISTP